VAEALVEATDHVKDEGAVGDHFAKSREVVSHLLQPAAVVGDGEVALDEVAKPRLKVDGASLPVAEELGLDGEPGMPGSGALGEDDLGKVVDERGDDPGLDDAVHPSLVRGDWGWRFLVDVVLKRELAEDEQELIAPAVEVAGVDVQDDGDVVLDVVDCDSLGV